MTWVIRITHMDEKKNQLQSQMMFDEHDLKFNEFDIRVEGVKEMLHLMDATLKEKEKNT